MEILEHAPVIPPALSPLTALMAPAAGAFPTIDLD